MDNASCVGSLLTIGRKTAELRSNMDVVKKSFLNGEPIQPWRTT
jgi:hypothetical protein